MQRYANGTASRAKQRIRLSLVRRLRPDTPRSGHNRRQEHSRPRDNRPIGRTYGDAVATPDVNRTRFAAFVARTLAGARAGGMTDRDIHAATGIPPSTFHRWQKGQFVTAPDLDKVRRFCEGLGVNLTGAMVALGMAPGRDPTAPEPPLPRDVLVILRRLADPNVPEQEKQFIRMTIAMLAERAVGRRREQAGEDAG